MNVLSTRQVRNLQRGVRGALVFGILSSVTANVIHSLTQPHDQTWQVWSSAGLAAIAPIVLFVTSEMVTRIPMHSKVLGVFRLLITLIIAGFSGWVSYWHMVDVSVMLGEISGSQFFYPLIIDGMMIVATISLIELGRIATKVDDEEKKVEVEKGQARKCKPGCTCKRHAPRKRTRRVSSKAHAPKIPAQIGVSQPVEIA